MSLRLITALLFTAIPVSGQPFLEKPYLQLGNAPKLAAQESLVLMWHTANTPAEWSVEVKTSKDAKWRAAAKPASQVASAPAGPAASDPIEPHLIYRANMTKLVPGEEFQYRVLLAGKQVFEATAKARKSASQPYRFVLFGDCAANTAGQRGVAYQTWLAKPDFVFIPGDIVYSSGRISEYRTKYFPVYNADEASATTGAPLIRSTTFIAAPGNHDTDLPHYRRFPDALAYFLYWDQPLNGPVAAKGAVKQSHVIEGNTDAQPAFLTAAEPRYPGMANFSFDYGNSHWTVLDANKYMDWSSPALQEWLKKDLAAAKSATFRFVAFHHPGFNSSKSHFTDQWMRLLAPIFEANHVDIVFAGHVHNYQRSFPLKFTPKPQKDGTAMGPKGEVDGDFTLDKGFGDGTTAKPQGVIYIVSGAGGAGLYNPEQTTDAASWQPFTNKFQSQENSMSLVDISGRKFSLKQISATGKVLDSFEINK